nr:hypothetical protein [Tanacetum cinerariifolium]
HLGKFKGKDDEGILVGYSVNSIEIHDNAGQAGQEKAFDHEYILLPFMLSLSTQSSDDKDVDEVPSKGDEGVSKGIGIDDQEKTDSSTQDVNTAGLSINTTNTNIDIGSLNISIVGSNDPSMPTLKETGIFDDVYDDREVGAEADTNNLELSTVVSLIPTTRVHKDHLKEQIIGDLNLATQIRKMINFYEENVMVIQALTDPSWIEAMQEELFQFKLQKAWTLIDLPNDKRAIGTKWIFKNKKDKRGIVIRNKARLVAQGYIQEEGINYDEMDVKSAFMYDTIEEEVYVYQPPGFEEPHFPNKVYKVEKALYGLHQAPKACQDKYVADILKKIDFTTVKTVSTPMEPNKALIKDAEAEDVPSYTKYFTSLCCEKNLQILKRKSTIGGCQFLSKRLILWQCKKQTIVANSTTKAEYVAAASCYEQVLWIQNQMLDYGFNLMNTKIYIDNENTICIVKT